MKHLLLIIIFALLPLSLFSQGDAVYFSDAIKTDLKKYKKQSSLAYRKGNIEYGKFLFDSLVKHRLAGTVFDNYHFKKLGGRELKLENIGRPVLLITYASWCVRSKGEIEALNTIAKKYHKDVEIVVLFWDRRENMKKAARKLSRHITACYAHESYRNDAPAIAAMKHTLGFPTSFFLDENLTVIDIRRCGMKLCPKNTTYEKGYAINYNSFLEGLSTIVIGRELKKEMLAVK